MTLEWGHSLLVILEVGVILEHSVLSRQPGFPPTPQITGLHDSHPWNIGFSPGLFLNKQVLNLFFSLKLRLWTRRWFSQALCILEDLKLDFSAPVKSQEGRITSVTLALEEQRWGRSQEFAGQLGKTICDLWNQGELLPQKKKKYG